MMRNFINGEKVYLRPLNYDDIEINYIHWFDDEEVCSGNSHHRFPITIEQMKNYINSINEKNLVLAIIESSKNIHIGNISLQNINYINRSAEFAIIIGEKEYWNGGYGKEAAKLILNHGFKTLNLNKIYCGTLENNIGMQKLALSTGFKQEGIRRKAEFKNGEYLDVIEYGLLLEEFSKI